MNQWRTMILALRPTPAPFAERKHDRQEFSALLSQDVLVAVRPGLIALAMQDPRFYQALQPAGQDVVGHAGVFEFLKAPLPTERIAHDQQRPPLPDHIERTGCRAGHLGQAYVFHGLTITHLHDASQYATVTFITQVKEA